MNKKLAITSGAGIVGAILASIIAVEGGYTNDPDDPGGATKYGITEKVARDWGYQGDMADLPKSTALQIYESLYVKEPNFDDFININPAIAHKLIDAGINVGTARVTLWLQKTLNAYSRNGINYPLIQEDGIVGKNTINAYKALEKIQGKVGACELVLKSLDSYQTIYYMSLTQYDKFLIGWMNKRVENVSLDQCSKYDLTYPLMKDENN